MSTGNQPWNYSGSPYLVTNGDEVDPEQWFAVQTRARHEKAVAQRLREVGVVTFLPLVKGVHRWSDRRKMVELPLFSCYVFVRLAPKNERRLRVLLIEGVLNFVGPRGQGIAIPDEQIDSLRRLLQEQLPYCSHPFLKIGQRVRIRSGALAGVEGILVSRSGERTLVVSVDAIDRSLAVRIEGYDVESI
jgi:transcription antitermination factor NusG